MPLSILRKNCLSRTILLTDQTGFPAFTTCFRMPDGIGEFLGEMRDRTFAPHNAFSVGEVFNEKDEELPDFIGDNGYFSSMFDFSAEIFGSSDKGWYDHTPITPDDYKKCCFTSQKRVNHIRFSFQYHRKP